MGAALLKLTQGEAPPGRILLLSAVFPPLFAVCFAGWSYFRNPQRSWPSLEDPVCRSWLVAALMLVSPVATALVAVCVNYLAVSGRLPQVFDDAAPLLVLATSLPAALGPAFGAILLRDSVAFRVGVGVFVAYAGFVTYWVIYFYLSFVLNYSP